MSKKLYTIITNLFYTGLTIGLLMLIWFGCREIIYDLIPDNYLRSTCTFLLFILITNKWYPWIKNK